MTTKRRMIHECIWASEHFIDLTDRQRLLWIGLITTADDQGRGRAHPGLVKATIFPFDKIDQEEIVAHLQALADSGLMILYEVEGRRYYQVVKWWEYQSMQWASASEYPAPDGWIDRFRYHSANRQIIKSDSWNDDKSLPRHLPSQLPRPGEEGKEEEEEEKDISSASADLQAIIDVYAVQFPDRRQHKATTQSLQSKAKTRMKDAAFRENWERALLRGGRSEWLKAQGWFDLSWFLKNDDNWQKVLAGNYDDKKNGNGKTSPPKKNNGRPDGLSEDDWMALQYISYNRDEDAATYRAELTAKGVKVDEWLSKIS